MKRNLVLTLGVLIGVYGLFHFIDLLWALLEYFTRTRDSIIDDHLYDIVVSLIGVPIFIIFLIISKREKKPN